MSIDEQSRAGYHAMFLQQRDDLSEQALKVASGDLVVEGVPQPELQMLFSEAATAHQRLATAFQSIHLQPA